MEYFIVQQQSITLIKSVPPDHHDILSPFVQIKKRKQKTNDDRLGKMRAATLFYTQSYVLCNMKSGKKRKNGNK